MPKAKRSFDFTRFKQRYVALKILYFGWDYDGLASQGDQDNTIEYHLFQALKKTCLIESRAKCCYNRCGRTDKGVSSFGQVINLSLRSNLIDENDPQNFGLYTPDDYKGSDNLSETRQELNYVNMLNRVLPVNIKIIAWAPVSKEFSSRFNCCSRSYSYIFPVGDLDIESMRKAASFLVGEHDFRNLCSFDLRHGVISHKRTILSADIEAVPYGESGFKQSYSFYQILIVGQAFLYHQIRCIMTVLFLVGTRKENPEIVRDLLNIEICTGRPNYNRASPLPLCLFDCKYSPTDLPLGWIHDTQALGNLTMQLKKMWTEYKTKTLMIERTLFELEPQHDIRAADERQGDGHPDGNWLDFGVSCDNMSASGYVPLLKRPRDETLETKLEALEKRKKTKEADR